MKRAWLLKALAGLAATFLIFAAAALAQTSTSVVRGTVTDPQGQAVPNAKLTLTNVATGAVRHTVTTNQGSYVFDLIEPATYSLQVEASGFKKQIVNNIVALIAKPTVTDVVMQLGEVSQTVEVTVARQDVLINNRDATLGNNFESQEITQLPLEARNVSDLLSLQPGATREGYVTGARADQGNVTLDGVDINNAQTGNAADATGNQLIGGLGNDKTDITSGPVLRLNAEAVEEFRVTTANGNADEGRSAGEQINLVTKSGTNDWHGAAFEFYRGTLFEANDWFSNHDGVPRTPLVRNTFGGALGGPIVKNKAFFFYSYEGRRDATAQPVVEVVPLPSLGQGIMNYTYCPDAACNSPQEASLTASQVQQVYAATGINSAALQALADAAAKYPANDTTVGDGLNTGGFRFNSPTPVKLNSHVAKLDFNLTSTQSLFVRANVIYDHQALPRQFPDTAPLGVWSHPEGLAIGHTWTIGTNWVNSFHYGLTRQAFTELGDSTGNDLSFRFVFQPTSQIHPLSRVTPVHDFTDDVSWTRGSHSFQFGATVLLVRNARVSFANAFDNGITNPSFYAGAGDHVSQTFQDYLDANGLPGDENAGQSLNSISEVQNAGTAVIGRLSQYTANFTFGKDGSLLPAGTPTDRTFATQSYAEYFQDTWKARHDLTLTLGLRYSLERPVYETHGFEVQPTVPLGTYFQERLAAAAQGNNFSDPIVINQSGPANGGKPMYNWDKNNFQPRLAFAWSPAFSGGPLSHLFPTHNQAVLRGGFAMTNDYYGQALAVDWDLNNTLGFTSNYTTPANTYDTSGSNLAPLFTGFNQDIRSLPNVVVPGSLVFPLSQPLDEGERIESSVDSTIHAPTEYVYNLTYERQLPAGMMLTLSYIGRAGRDLLARRDVAAFNDVRDPASGMDWYTAATTLEKQRQKGVDTSQIASIPFFENLFPSGLATIMNDTFGLDPVCSSSDPNPGFDPTWSNTQVFYAMQSRGGGSIPGNPCAFFAGNDWTDTQALIDQVGVFGTSPFPTRFMQPQYGALSAWSSIAISNYNAFAVSLRERVSALTLDFNYTYAHSLDNASGLQTEGAYGSNTNNGPFIENPIRPGANYANSDFDIRHNINVLAVWQMPFGKGKAFLGGANNAVQAIVGGWQLSGIFRWNTGIPVSSPFDDARWATNWNAQANVTPTMPIHTCPSRSDTPKLFGGSGCDLKTIYDGFRNAYPGETGPRNYIRYPAYSSMDVGLDKTFAMPWSDKQTLQIRWETFNVANFQPFGLIDLSRTGFGVVRDPGLRASNPPSNWSNFTNIQGDPRVMQVGARFAF